jgi:hypothetical protein
MALIKSIVPSSIFLRKLGPTLLSPIGNLTRELGQVGPKESIPMGTFFPRWFPSTLFEWFSWINIWEKSLEKRWMLGKIFEFKIYYFKGDFKTLHHVLLIRKFYLK